jgi:hypothetical protein
MRSTIPFLVAATLLGEIQAASAQSPTSYHGVRGSDRTMEPPAISQAISSA